MTRARTVRIDEEAAVAYAQALPPELRDGRLAAAKGSADPEATAAFAICMNAINFGSGWWPTVRKRPGLSGYATMAAGVEERFAADGAWGAAELITMEAETIACVLGQDPAHPLMTQFAAALRNVGEHLRNDGDGRYLGIIKGASSMPELAEIFASWKSFADVSSYEGREIPFYKRAQLAAADLRRGGVVDLPGAGCLTAFADNLVPHVLRLDGVLRLDPELERKIEAGELLEHGSAEEVELRAAAVQAVELLTAAGNGLLPAEVDGFLWNRGGGRRYKLRPRPRSRNTAY
jgi:hypothetical protein